MRSGRRAEGVGRKLCCMTLDDAEAVVMGKEPIVDGDGVLGYVTSANYGHSIGRGIVYGYLPTEYARLGRRWMCCTSGSGLGRRLQKSLCTTRTAAR